MRKLFATILIIIFLVMAAPTEASSRSIAFTKVPAVYQTPDGLTRGSLGNLTVEIEPGKGRVFFSADPLTQIDTQGAARTAALVASYVLGKDPLSYDFYYRLESDSMIIGGPSAGAAMTVATIAALLGKELRQDVLMTGMINPDGTIGPVGGIPEKLEAAAEGGAKIFLVPAGQRIVVRTIPKEVRIGPFIMTQVEREKVDLVELGKKLGVEVREVSNIAEAAKYFLGINLKMPSPKEPEVPEDVKKVILEWVDHYLNASESISKSVMVKLKDVSFPVRKEVEDILKSSKMLANQARKEIRDGKYYSASSSAFQSTFQAEYAKRLLEYALEGPSSVEKLISDVSSSVREIGAKLNATKPNSFSSLEALVAAKTRYYLAKEALATGARLASKKVYFDSSSNWGAIHTLSYALWRAETAETWTWLFNVGRGGVVSEDRVRKVASILLYEAESVVSYTVSLLQDVGGSSSLLDEASSDLETAGSAFSSGDPYGSLGLAASALAKATAAIHQWFTSDPNVVLSSVKEISYSSINELLSRGIAPVLALSYAETAKAYEEEKDIFNAIVYYEMSSAHAHMLSLLSRQPEKPVQTGTETKTQTPTTTVTQTPPSSTPRPTETTPSRQETIIQYLPFLIASLLIGLLIGYALGRH